MATIDSNILLQARPPDAMQAAANGFNVSSAVKQAPIKNRLLESQVQAQELQNKVSRQTLDAETAKFQLQDAASDAMAIRPLIESGDTLRANVLIAERIKKIQDRGGDPSDTIALRDQLNAGNVKGVLGELKTVEDLATRVGIFNGGNSDLRQQEIDLRRKALEQDASQFDAQLKMREREANTPRQQMTPSAVAEYEYYRSLTPEQQAQYDAMKRGTPGYSSTTEKEIYGASDAYVEDNAAFENYTDLANRYEQAQGRLTSGAAGTVQEWLKEQTGNQDELTALRKDWSKIKASELVRNLPPGAASDSDIMLAKEGFLPTNADPKTVASFLRGLAKLRKLNAEYNAFKADYLSEKKNPGGLRQEWQQRATELNVGGPTNSASQSGGLQPGAVEDGYRFKGGNPADPNNWEAM